MNLSTVIVNWNSGGRLDRLLGSLLPLGGEIDETVVVDNASRDRSCARLGSDEQIRLIALSRNEGFAGAANRGIESVETDFVLLVNPDVEVNPEAVRGLYRVLQAFPAAAIVSGPLIDSRGRTQQSFQVRKFPTFWSVLGDALFLDELADLSAQLLNLKQEKPPGKKMVLQNPDEPSGPPVPPVPLWEIEQPAAAFWILRRSAWRQLGGFDVSFHPAWFEDVDFCRRLVEAGWKIIFAGVPATRHEGGHTLEHLSYGEFIRTYYGNLRRYLKKHHRRQALLLAPAIGLGVALRIAFGRKS